MSSPSTRSVERQVVEVEEREDLVAVADGVVVRLEQVLAADLAVGVVQMLESASASPRAAARGRPTRNSPTPRTSTTRTAWCAVSARPDSETIVGCGTPSASHSFERAEDDVVGVLLERVVHRRAEVGLRAVVVDAEAAADVEVAERRAELVELDVEARRPRAARS
jgi:hypothetical protein